MRTIKLIFIIPCILFIFSGCGKDKYEEPNATVSGALIDGETNGALQLKQDGSTSVRMIVNNPAKYPAPGTYDITTKADGKFFTSRAFAEKYKIFPLAANGPYVYLKAGTTAGSTVPNDSVNITLTANGKSEVNFKVNPYLYVEASGVDSTITFKVTRSAFNALYNLSNPNTNDDVLILINTYPIVNEGVSSNSSDANTYRNQFKYTYKTSTVAPAAGSLVYGQAYTQTIPFWRTRYAHGKDYYFRVAVLGEKSNGFFNYSPVFKVTVH
jgi:hypothetical protein